MIAEFKGDYTKMTCGGCVRFMENCKVTGTYTCSDINGPKSIEAETPACKGYWDSVEQNALEEAEKVKAEEARQRAWNQNQGNSPRPAKWVRDWDDIRGCWTGAMPFCPNCDEPLYETDRCYFCGQKIEQDADMTKFQEPPKEKRMNCFLCGGMNTVVYVESDYNGHKHGECQKCGMRFME